MLYPNLRHLEIFLSLCESGTVTKTAQRLNITQPAVSKAISALEEMIQIRLFERRRNRLHLTANGRQIRDEAERLLNQVNAFGSEIEALQTARRGSVSILAIPSLAAGAVARAVGDFSVSHPGIHVRFGLAMSHEVSGMVAQNRVDVGLVHGSSGLPGLQETFVAETHVQCLMAATHPLAQRGALGPADLVHYPLISFDAVAPLSAQIRESFTREGLRPTIRAEINAALLAIQAVREEMIAFVDPFSIDPGPDLVLRPFQPRIALAIHIVTPLNKTPSLPVAAFCETVRHAIFRAVTRRDASG